MTETMALEESVTASSLSDLSKEGENFREVMSFLFQFISGIAEDGEVIISVPLLDNTTVGCYHNLVTLKFSFFQGDFEYKGFALPLGEIEDTNVIKRLENFGKLFIEKVLIGLKEIKEDVGLDYVISVSSPEELNSLFEDLQTLLSATTSQ